MHYTSSFSDFSLLQLRELLINGPDAKHHDNLQGTVFEDTENSQEHSAFAHRQNGDWCLQTYHAELLFWITLLCISLAVCLSEITASENVVLYSVCIAIIFQYSYSTRCVYYFLILSNMFRL